MVIRSKIRKELIILNNRIELIKSQEKEIKKWIFHVLKSNKYERNIYNLCNPILHFTQPMDCLHDKRDYEISFISGNGLINELLMRNDLYNYKRKQMKSNLTYNKLKPVIDWVYDDILYMELWYIEYCKNNANNLM